MAESAPSRDCRRTDHANQCVSAAADYANGGFPSLPFEEWSFMSVDLTVQLTRRFRAQIK